MREASHRNHWSATLEISFGVPWSFCSAAQCRTFPPRLVASFLGPLMPFETNYPTLLHKASPAFLNVTVAGPHAPAEKCYSCFHTEAMLSWISFFEKVSVSTGPLDILLWYSISRLYQNRLLETSILWPFIVWWMSLGTLIENRLHILCRTRFVSSFEN